VSAARGWGVAMRFRDVSMRTAKQLGSDRATVEYIVEGWLRVAMTLLADGHSVPTVLGTLRTKRADARLQRSRGYRRELKIVTSLELERSSTALAPRAAIRSGVARFAHSRHPSEWTSRRAIAPPPSWAHRLGAVCAFRPASG